MTDTTNLGLTALVLLATACGGGAATGASPGATTEPSSATGSVSAGPVVQSGDRTVTAEIGPAGGTLSLSNGSRVVFAAGALSDPFDVHFTVASQTQAFNNNDYERPVGPTIHLQPEMSVSAPVTVSIPAAPIPSEFRDGDLTLAMEVPAAGQRAGVMGSTQTTWNHVEARSEAGRFVADLTEVPGMRLQFVVSEPE